MIQIKMNLIKQVQQAEENLKDIIQKTPLELSERLSKIYNANIYLKREDLNKTRSFKIRGAFNKILSLKNLAQKNGVVTASAGNHAQGVAFACNKLKIFGTIFMPQTTPLQKVQRVKYFGGNFIECKLIGSNFDEAEKAAKIFAKKHKNVYIPPFDDMKVILGQATVAKEIYNDLKNIHMVIAGIGGGGLISGLGIYFKNINPEIKVIGVEPSGADAMNKSIKANKRIVLHYVDNFVDGAAVKKVGHLTFQLVKKYVDKIIVVNEGAVAQTMIELYQNEGIIAEPAGALSVTALELLKNKIKNKNIVCVISGGNNDLLRYPEILEKSLIYQGKKHYFLIEFAQKPGQLKKFVNNVLGPNDDIVLFEYIKTNNKEKGPALIGIETQNKQDLKAIINNLKKFGFIYRKVEIDDPLYSYLIK
jgi:threonine dehydratase